MAKKTYLSLILITLLVFKGFCQLIPTDSVPLDPRVRVGKLENGLQYYIQYNPKPENKLEMRLAIKVGSVQEKESQLGLAHFTEHMAFNGSEHFEKNELISYLQSIGVTFGSDLNAYTSFDETVYILPIPTDDEAKLDTGFLVLKDWAGGVSLKEEDIDAERSIIVEEWRRGQGPSQRMRDQYFPVLMHESLYAERLPIGDMDIIRNSDYKEIRDFYRNWYRPELMAIIAVGDVEPSKVEEKIRTFFGDLTNPDDAPERTYPEVPVHEESLVKIVTDEEAPGIQVQLFYKHPPAGTNTYLDYRKRILRTMYGGLLTQRLDLIRQQPDAPFYYAGARYGNMVKGLDFFTISGSVGPGKTIAGLEAFLTENQRVLQHGFTLPELERVKRSLTNSAERSFKEMDKVESRSLVGRYVSNFLEGSFAEGEAQRYRIYQEILPTITLEEINELGNELIREDNRVVIVTAPEKDAETLPEEQELLALFDLVEAMDLAPYKEKELRDELLSKIPEAGEVIQKDHLNSVDITTITLSNGVKVHFKPTDYKNDQIIFSGTSKGGTSLYPDEDHYSASFASGLVNVMGIGDFEPSDLKKILAGKNVQVTPNIGTYSESLSGTTSPRDFELALQLMNLYFTETRKDEQLYQVYLDNYRDQLESAQVNPDFQFNKKVNEIISNGNKRALGMYDPELLDQINLDRSLEIYTERFSNAGDFEFLFTGNLDLEKVIPLVALYLGSLPGEPLNKEDYRDLGISAPQGITEEIKVGVDDKSEVVLYFSGETDYDLEKSQQISYLGEILTIKLIETLREEIGGVYGVSARGGLSRVPEEKFNFMVRFPCSPDMVEDLIAGTWEEIAKIQENGPEETDMEKVRASKRISLEENMKRNGFWHSQLNAAITSGMPLDTVLGAKNRVLGVSKEEVKMVANEFLKEEYLLEILRFPLTYGTIEAD
ncbi:MAG: insulinase family protein [Cyclobacteriaceae bacterium]